MSDVATLAQSSSSKMALPAAGVTRNEQARLRMAQYRTTAAYQAWLVSSREMRKEHKAKYRLQAGSRLRVDMDAESLARRAVAAQVVAGYHGLHDAHVRRYAGVMSSRRKSKQRYDRSPEAEGARVSLYKQRLPDAYIIQNLKVMGVPTAVITPEVIGIKRESMQYRRLAKEIKSTLKNLWKAEHEAITKHT